MSPLMERLRYRGPKFDRDGVVVSGFTIGGPDESFGAWLANLEYESQGRGCEPGQYARLIVDGELWMSDTTSERRDHREPVAMGDLLGGNALVNGLGLGCVVTAMLDTVDHVDVVERDQRIVRTVGRWLRSEYGDRVTVHHADAYTKQWPKGTRWRVVWHDIWPTIASDNLDEMTRLHRKYGSRCDWQGSWCQTECRWMRRKEAEWAVYPERAFL
jgi:hypothetical protein